MSNKLVAFSANGSDWLVSRYTLFIVHRETNHCGPFTQWRVEIREAALKALGASNHA